MKYLVINHPIITTIISIRYGLEYLAVGIWRGLSFYGSMAVGPFISSMSVIDLIKDIISKNNLPVGERKQLEQFYQSLPVLSETGI